MVHSSPTLQVSADVSFQQASPPSIVDFGQQLTFNHTNISMWGHIISVWFEEWYATAEILSKVYVDAFLSFIVVI